MDVPADRICRNTEAIFNPMDCLRIRWQAMGLPGDSSCPCCGNRTSTASMRNMLFVDSRLAWFIMPHDRGCIRIGKYHLFSIQCKRSLVSNFCAFAMHSCLKRTSPSCWVCLYLTSTWDAKWVPSLESWMCLPVTTNSSYLPGNDHISPTIRHFWIGWFSKRPVKGGICVRFLDDGDDLSHPEGGYTLHVI